MCIHGVHNISIKVYRTDDDDSDENSKEGCSYLLSTLQDNLMVFCIDLIYYFQNRKSLIEFLIHFCRRTDNRTEMNR